MSIHHRLKLLIACSKNKWRSPTAENIYRGDSRVEIRTAGTSLSAVHHISIKDIEWADMILCMESKHKVYIQQKFQELRLPPTKVLDIPDEYRYMDPELVKILRADIETILKQ